MIRRIYFIYAIFICFLTFSFGCLTWVMEEAVFFPKFQNGRASVEVKLSRNSAIWSLYIAQKADNIINTDNIIISCSIKNLSDNNLVFYPYGVHKELKKNQTLECFKGKLNHLNLMVNSREREKLYFLITVEVVEPIINDNAINNLHLYINAVSVDGV